MNIYEFVHLQVGCDGPYRPVRIRKNSYASDNILLSFLFRIKELKFFDFIMDIGIEILSVLVYKVNLLRFWSLQLLKIQKCCTRFKILENQCGSRFASIVDMLATCENDGFNPF